MPRAVDRYQPQADYDPTRSGTEFHIQKLISSEAEILAMLAKTLGDGFKRTVIGVIEALTGIDLEALGPVLDELDLDFSSPTAFLTSLVNAISATPEILVTLISAIITEIAAGSLEDKLNELLFALIELLVSLPTLLMDLGNALVESGAGLLGLNSPINLSNAFNQLPTDLAGLISHSVIGEAITNLIADPNFLDFEGLSTVEGWVHDLTGGHGGTGSMTVTANGTAHELLSPLIPASRGQVMPITGKAKWAGLTGTGNPVQLAVTGYSALGSVTDQQVLASHNTIPPTTDWVDLAGTYTVPADVASIRTRLVVTPAATAGTVSFSKLTATKIQTMFQRLIAGTDPGQILTDDIENLFSGIVTNALTLLEKVDQAAHDNLLTALGGPDLGTIEARIDSFLHSLSPLNANNINTGQIADIHVPGLNTIHDALVTAVGALSGSGFDIGKVFEVLDGQRHAVVDSSSSLVNMFIRMSGAEQKLAALPVSLGGTGVGLGFGGVTGVTDTDDFERTGSNPGPLWSVSYQGAGTVGTPNGHDLSFQTSGTGDTDYLMIRNNSSIPRSATDYQRVIQVVSAKSTRFYDALLGTYNYAGENFLWLRISDASTNLTNVTGIRIGFGGDGNLSIVRFLSGAPTILKAFPPGTITPPGPGAILIGEAGDMNGGTAGQRYFRGIIGSSLRIDVTETGTASGFGAAFRRWGTGGRAEGHVLPLPGQEKPGSLHYWTGIDQQIG